MLAKKYRLPIQEMTSKKGRTYKSAFFAIKVFSGGKEFSRFGVVVSKKVCKTAVARNRVRRALYDALFLIRDRWPIADYLIIVNQFVVGLNQKQINESIIQFSFN